MNISNTIYNLVGFLGASLILLGFYRVSIGRWTNKSLWYELDNLMGAGLLVFYQIHTGAYVTVVLNTIWVIVAFRGLTSFATRYSWRPNASKKRKRGT